MLINPTWVHQISSNLVDLNVSLWMIFPQSFSHPSQFAYNFMVFPNVLQMASSALKAHLHTSCKIVNDSHTFLPRDFPELCCDCCLQFTNCLRIVLINIILEIPPRFSSLVNALPTRFYTSCRSLCLQIAL